MQVKPIMLNKQTNLHQLKKELNRGYNDFGGEDNRENFQLELEDDGNGGITNEDRENQEGVDQEMEETHQDEPICFDQTNRNIGSIQKNMVLSERDRSILGTNVKGFGGRGAATKAMLGLNPASTMPNYTLGINAGAQQPTYRPGMANGGQQFGNSTSQYSMINTRLPNQSTDTDGPRGMDQVWQVVNDQNQFGDAAGAADEGYYA